MPAASRVVSCRGLRVSGSWRSAVALTDSQSVVGEVNKAASWIRTGHTISDSTGRRIDVPAAVAVFKACFPRQFVARGYTDLRRFAVMPRGGHFPAAEEPRALVADLWAFLRTLRG
jgi:hypothetical protein